MPVCKEEQDGLGLALGLALGFALGFALVLAEDRDRIHLHWIEQSISQFRRDFIKPSRLRLERFRGKFLHSFELKNELPIFRLWCTKDVRVERRCDCFCVLGDLRRVLSKEIDLGCEAADHRPGDGPPRVADHGEGQRDDRDDSFLEGVQLSGVKLVPSAIEEDHSLSEGSSEGIRLPIFDGEHGGSAAPKRGPLDEAIDKVNEMFKAKGVDVSPGSVSGFITTFWGFLDANEEAVAMAKNNTVAQLKASEGFSGAVGLAVLKTVNESKEIHSYMTDPAFLGEISVVAAEALHSAHASESLPTPVSEEGP